MDVLCFKIRFFALFYAGRCFKKNKNLFSPALVQKTDAKKRSHCAFRAARLSAIYAETIERTSSPSSEGKQREEMITSNDHDRASAAPQDTKSFKKHQHKSDIDAVKAQPWSSNERPESLLIEIQDMIGEEAREEEATIFQQIRRKERLERLRNLEEEARIRREGEEQIQAARADLAARRAAARATPSAVAPPAAPKEREARFATVVSSQLLRVRDLIAEQRGALRRLKETPTTPIRDTTPATPPSRSPLPMLLALTALIAAVLGIFSLSSNETPPIEAASAEVILSTTAGELVAFEIAPDYHANPLQRSVEVTRSWEVESVFSSKSEAPEAPKVTAKPKPRRPRVRVPKSNDTNSIRGGRGSLDKLRGDRGTIRTPSTTRTPNVGLDSLDRKCKTLSDCK